MLPPVLLGAPVTLGSVPTVADPLWDGPLGQTSQHVTANPTRAVLTVAGVGAFAVDHGRHVVVELVAGGDEVLVETHLFGTVAALLLAQQGRLALHATSVEIDGVGVAITGRSGAGKSTTGLALARRGHRLVADDVSALEADGDNDVAVAPFGRPVHVWPETLTALGTSAGPSRRLPETGKLVLPAPAAGTTPLRALAVLRPEPDPGTDQVTVISLTPPEALSRVAGQIYRRPIIGQVWPDVVFRWMTAVTSTVAVSVIRRPAQGWTAPAVADAIESLAAAAIPAVR